MRYSLSHNDERNDFVYWKSLLSTMEERQKKVPTNVSKIAVACEQALWSRKEERKQNKGRERAKKREGSALFPHCRVC